MARGRATGYDGQREAILTATAKLFAQQGYVATSMNEVARACGLSKASIYHYFRDKNALLVSIAEGHVQRLEAVVLEVHEDTDDAHLRLERLIRRFVEEYAHAQDAHRVLTADLRFLQDNDSVRIVACERRVVAAFSGAICAIRPELDAAQLATPLTMLLFGMINWMFTWLKPDGTLTHEALAGIVTDLFFGGLPAVQVKPDRLSRKK